MRLSPRLVCAAVLASTLFLSGAARAEDQDSIDYRRHIMATLGEEAAAIGQILQKKAPADDLAVHAQILAVTAATAKKAFEPKAPGGEAKPGVWANWNDFAKRLDELTAATADLAKTAKEGGLAASAPKVEALGCRSCHDTYREKSTAAAPSVKADDAVEYREHVMKSLNEQSAALGMILSTVIPEDGETAHMEAIALSARIGLKAFEPKVPGGQAKPELWTNWPDFSKRMNDFARKTDEMARLAQEKGPEAASGTIVEALSCKSCHDLYRNENKK